MEGKPLGVFPIDSISPEKFKEDVIEFLLGRKEYQKQLHSLLKRIDETVPYGFKLSFIDFHSKFQEHAALLLSYPSHYLALLDEALVEAQQRYLELFSGNSKSEGMTIKLNVHTRVERYVKSG